MRKLARFGLALALLLLVILPYSTASIPVITRAPSIATS